MAKARILEITLSVIGAGEDGHPYPDMLQFANPAGLNPNDTDTDLASGTIADNASGDRLVISVRIRGARKCARYRVG